MDSHHPAGRLVVHRLDSDFIQTVNRAANRAAEPLSARITDGVSVQDLEARSVHLVLVHRVDVRPDKAATVGNVVVFSKPCHAVFRTEQLQLATPDHYRTHDDSKIRDPHDGMLTKDASRLVSAGGAHFEMSFGSPQKPWVFCASHYRSNQDLRRLRDYFAAHRRTPYAAATRILDPNAFATRLGIDFALGLDKTNAVRPEGPEVLIDFFNNTFDTVVCVHHVHHGPVHYEDSSGRITTQEDLANTINDSPKAWFTKKTCFEIESEYRFAVSTAAGTPVEPRHYIAVSRELRELTSDLDLLRFTPRWAQVAPR